MRAKAVVACGLAAAALLAAYLAPASAQSNQSHKARFNQFITELWPEARAFGITRATFDRAFKGVTPNLKLPDLAIPGKLKRVTGGGQAEFVKPPQRYLSKRQLANLAKRGKTFMKKHLGALQRIETEIGVERHVIMGIWGRETAYGTYKLPHYAIRVLATQAYTGRRKELFRNELLHALRLLEKQIITRRQMRSSWAGALGLPQFMPSEYDKHTYDLDRDGKRDIWKSVPDALASAAKQLKDKGWTKGLRWGFEVVLPPKVDCALEGPGDGRTLAAWIKLGVKRKNGKPFPAEHMNQSAYMMSPGGTNGPIFLATNNFKVYRLYNMSDLYAVFVGHLADRIAGGGDFVTPWRNIKQLSTTGLEETQQRLKDLGYAITVVDGKIGSNTRKQIGLFQRASGMTVDCWPSKKTLKELRVASKRQ